jgi:hypothetical protein
MLNLNSISYILVTTQYFRVSLGDTYWTYQGSLPKTPLNPQRIEACFYHDGLWALQAGGGGEVGASAALRILAWDRIFLGVQASFTWKTPGISDKSGEGADFGCDVQQNLSSGSLRQVLQPPQPASPVRKHADARPATPHAIRDLPPTAVTEIPL